MHPDYRKHPLCLLSDTEQAIAEAEVVTVAERVDGTLQGAIKELAELQETRAAIESKPSGARSDGENEL
jgi:F420-0:gamma-glutamyl ligase